MTTTLGQHMTAGYRIARRGTARKALILAALATLGLGAGPAPDACTIRAAIALVRHGVLLWLGLASAAALALPLLTGVGGA